MSAEARIIGHRLNRTQYDRFNKLFKMASTSY